MAHFPKHLPVQWELFRNEPLKAQVRREAQRYQIEEIDKGRRQSDGLWWPDQRYVDVVVPAEYVNPDSIDTFNYRYQVYARPPPVQCEPQTIAEANDGAQPPLRYNIKRIAQCKPVDLDAPHCWAHWERHPFALTRDSSEQGSDRELQRQSKNNNSCVERPDVRAAADSPAPAFQQYSCAVQPLRMGCSQESRPREGSVAVDCHAPRKTPVRLSPIGQNTNRNRGAENFDRPGRREGFAESPRSCRSFSSSCTSDNNNHTTAASKTRTDLRGDAVNDRVALLRQSPQWDMDSDAGIACKETDVGSAPQRVSQAQDPRPSTQMDAVDTLCAGKQTTEDRVDTLGMDGQGSLDRQKTNVGATHSFLKSVLSMDNLKMETPNDANNNKRKQPVSSTDSLHSSVDGRKCFEGGRLAERSKSQISELSGARSDRVMAQSVAHSMLNEQKYTRSDATSPASELADRGQIVRDQAGRGKRFGYNTPSSQDSVSSLLVGQVRGNVPSILTPIQPKPTQSVGFPLTNVASLGTCIASTLMDSASLTKVKKGGKRTGYQAKAVKDSIVFGGCGNLKDYSLSLHKGGERRSCQTGGYRSLANSDNLKSLIFPENVNGNNAQSKTPDEEDERRKIGEDTIKIDQFILGEDDRKDSTTTSPADLDLPILPFCSAVSLCTNNNSAISDPILDIQLDRSCQLHNERHLHPPNRGENRIHADGRKPSEIPYDTYKIVGGMQYRSRPPEDLLSELKLPPHLAEYQEFTRRCPNYKVGRYDRSDPANEMLLPSNKTMHTLKMTLNPFMYARNPKAEKIPPLFYTTTDNSELKWPMAASKDANKSAKTSQ
ncbi:hypothetical protein Btru_037254 [Bulinus truncatus]|nr:hypothetical protein Btru_037254 [Bulinus truncatus]